MARDCGDNDAGCDARTSGAWAGLTGVVRHTIARCFSTADLGLNIILALKDIATSIREYTAITTKKGFACGAYEFFVPGGASLTNGQMKSVQLSMTPFDLKITGFGISTMNWVNGGGSYASDDVLHIMLWDFTSGIQIGQTLDISGAQVHAQDSDQGTMLGELYPGHVYGIKFIYNNLDGGAFTQPNLHVIVYGEPQELIDPNQQ